MNKSILKKALIMISAVMIAISSLQIDVFATENVMVGFESIQAHDKLSETLTITTSPKDGVEVESITLPDNTVVLGDTATYTSYENGTAKFIITYNKITSNDTEELTTIKDTQIASFEFQKIETFNEVEVKGNLSSNVVTTITVVDGEDSEQWQNNTKRTVQVRVDFIGNTTDNKELTVTIPKGMKYASIEVDADYAPTAKVEEELLSQLLAGSIHDESIIKTTVPEMENRSYFPSTYGSVHYELKPTTEFVVFEFEILVDSTRYYAPHEIKNAISAVSTCGTQRDASILDIDASGPIVMAQGTYRDDVSQLLREVSNSSSFTSEVVATKEGVIGLGGTRQYITTHGSSSHDVANYLPELPTYHIYYPEGMKFHSVIISGSTEITRQMIDEGKVGSHLEITYDDSQAKATVTIKNMANYMVSVKYEIPEGTPAGEYTPKQPTTLEFVTYDGKEYKDIEARPYSSSNEIIPMDTVTVLDPDEIVERYKFSASNTYVDKETEYFYAGKIYDRNISSLESKPITVEISIDDTFQAKIVRVPSDSSASVSNIIVTTSLGNVMEVDPSKTTYYMNRTSIDANTIGLAENEYIKHVKADVGIFKSNYSTNNNGGNLEYALAYGKLVEGATSSQITIKSYETGTSEIGLIEGTSKMIPSSLKTTTTDMDAMFTMNSEEIVSAYAGNNLKLEIEDVNIFSYPYGTMMSLQNPHVYLRESKGYEFNHDTITFSNHQTKEEIEASVYKVYEYTTTEGINEKIYVYQLNNFGIANALNYPVEQSSFDMNVEIITDFTLDEDVNYTVNDMIGIGQTKVSGATSGYSDYFMENGIDVNEDGDVSDRIASLWKRENHAIEIKKNNSAIVETFFKVDGDDTPANEYDPSNPGTAVEFNPKSNATYSVVINNVSAFPADDFVIYVPIPKAGQNYGENFQAEDFNWNMQLSNEITGLDSKYRISYTNKLDATNYNDPSIYGQISEEMPLDSVTMVRIELKKESGGALEAGEIVNIDIPIKAVESSGSDESEQRNGSINAYNSYYSIASSVASGSVAATPVGAKLVIREIAGFAFEDSNRDAIYQESDKLLANTKVELFKFNKETNEYELYPSLDGKVYTTTDANGKYSFNESWGLTNGTYSVIFESPDMHKFVPMNVGDEKVDSDVGLTGMLEDIDPLQSSSRFISAGSIVYEEDYLQTHLNVIEMEEHSSIEIELNKADLLDTTKNSITPSHFDLIKDKTNGYVWTVGNSALATVSSMTMETGSVSIDSLNVDDKSVDVTNLLLSIKDIYSKVDSTSAPLIIYDENAVSSINETHVIAAQNATISYNEAIHLTSESAIEKTKANAFKIYPTIISTQVEVDQDDLQSINTVSREGDILPLSLCVNGVYVEVTITIQSNALPEINGLSNLEVAKGRSVDIKTGVTAFDLEDKDLTNVIDYPDTLIENLTLGEHTLKYSVTDSDGNIVIIDRKITVLKNDAPIISGLKDKFITLRDVNDYDFKADIINVSDDYTNLTIEDVIVDGMIQLPEVGSKEESKIIYTLSDSEGNVREESVSITVTNYLPEIAGLDDIQIVEGTNFDFKTGVIASDFEDQDITSLITYPNIDIPSLSIGKHIIEYSVIDKDGNVVKSYRNIIITEKEVIDQSDIIDSNNNDKDNNMESENGEVLGYITNNTENSDSTNDKVIDNLENKDDNTDTSKSGNTSHSCIMYIIILIYVLFMLCLFHRRRYAGIYYKKTNILVTVVLLAIQALIGILFKSPHLAIIMLIFIGVIILLNAIYSKINYKHLEECTEV